jgi:hypothetical protein
VPSQVPSTDHSVVVLAEHSTAAQGGAAGDLDELLAHTAEIWHQFCIRRKDDLGEGIRVVRPFVKSIYFSFCRKKFQHVLHILRLHRLIDFTAVVEVPLQALRAEGLRSIHIPRDFIECLQQCTSSRKHDEPLGQTVAP